MFLLFCPIFFRFRFFSYQILIFPPNTLGMSAKPTSRKKRYSANFDFWKQVDPNVDGMLQGYSHLSGYDRNSSIQFLAPLLSGPKALTQPTRVLDCGAGIGRVSREVLLPLFETADLVDQNERFLASAPSFIGPELADKWVIGYLTDSDLTAFFMRCKSALTSDGFIVIKDNFTKSSEQDFDEDDGSVCRPEATVVHLLKRAGFAVVKTATQPNFPAELYPVRMIAAVSIERRRALKKQQDNIF